VAKKKDFFWKILCRVRIFLQFFYNNRCHQCRG
jgi:hypothetical protein